MECRNPDQNGDEWNSEEGCWSHLSGDGSKGERALHLWAGMDQTRIRYSVKPISVDGEILLDVLVFLRFSYDYCIFFIWYGF